MEAEILFRISRKIALAEARVQALERRTIRSANERLLIRPSATGLVLSVQMPAAVGDSGVSALAPQLIIFINNSGISVPVAVYLSLAGGIEDPAQSDLLGSSVIADGDRWSLLFPPLTGDPGHDATPAYWYRNGQAPPLGLAVNRPPYPIAGGAYIL